MNVFRIKNFKKYLEDRLSKDRRSNCNLFAATLKNERVRLNMTLEDMTQNICSKSYLSKIENNVLNGDEYILRSLFERVSVNYNDLVQIDHAGQLSSYITEYLLGKYEAIHEKVELIKVNYFVAKNSIIYMLHYLIKKDYEQFVAVAKEVEGVKTSLSDEEAEAFVILVIEFLIQTHQFKLAQEYLKEFEQFKIENPYVQFLFLEQVYKVSANLHDYAGMFRVYSRLLDGQNEYPTRQKFIIKLLFMELFEELTVQKSFDDLSMDYIPEEYREDFTYSKCLNFLKKKRYQSVIEKIIDKNQTEARFLALYGFSLLGLKHRNREIEQFDEYVQRFWELYESMDHAPEERVHLNFLKYIVMRLKEVDEETIFDYLKNFLVFNMTSEQHRFYTPYYSYKYTSMLGLRSRYKDAFLFTKSDSFCHKNCRFEFDF